MVRQMAISVIKIKEMGKGHSECQGGKKVVIYFLKKIFPNFKYN